MSDEMYPEGDGVESLRWGVADKTDWPWWKLRPDFLILISYPYPVMGYAHRVKQ